MISEALRALCGRWRPPDSSVLVEVTSDGQELHVRAMDTEDGEELRVLALVWDHESISFTMITPSTSWTVQQELRSAENGAIACRTTIVEQWERA